MPHLKVSRFAELHDLAVQRNAQSSSRDRSKLAKNLHRYLIFRADQEGVKYSLSPESFLDALRKGATKFFGISVDSNGLQADEQNPEAFARWTSLN
jgi:hypothetical protein